LKNLLTNFYFHGAILLVCAVVMVINVIATGANSLDGLTVVGKIAAIIFILDLFSFVIFTMSKALFGKK